MRWPAEGRRTPFPAACLGLPKEAEGAADLIVHPRYRSSGVATDLLERIYDRWSTDVLRIWAYGSHPAAERAAARLGLAVGRVEHELIRPTRRPASPDGTDLPARGLDEAGLGVDPAAADLIPELRTLVEQGCRQARIIVGEGHPELATLRALGFRHDQTNRQYRVPVASWVREKLKDEEDRCGQHA